MREKGVKMYTLEIQLLMLIKFSYVLAHIIEGSLLCSLKNSRLPGVFILQIVLHISVFSFFFSLLSFFDNRKRTF